MRCVRLGTQRPETLQVQAGIREKSGSGSSPWAIRSEVIRWLLLHWTLLPQHLYPGSLCRGDAPGPEAGSERAVGRETAVQTPGKRIP